MPALRFLKHTELCNACPCDKYNASHSCLAPQKKQRKAAAGDASSAQVRVGSTVSKEFPGYGTFKGKVVGFDAKHDLWKVRYDDDDEEELTTADIIPLLVGSG